MKVTSSWNHACIDCLISLLVSIKNCQEYYVLHSGRGISCWLLARASEATLPGWAWTGRSFQCGWCKAVLFAWEVIWSRQVSDWRSCMEILVLCIYWIVVLLICVWSLACSSLHTLHWTNQQMEDLAPGTDLLRRCLKLYSYITLGVSNTCTFWASQYTDWLGIRRKTLANTYALWCCLLHWPWAIHRGSSSINTGMFRC